MAPGALKATILINNYNYGRYLGAAIDSALNQTYGLYEVVVVDDGSTDDSRAIIASYGDRVRAVLKENGGQATAFNEGFRASRGDVICMLDADDFFYDTKLERIIAAFDANPEAQWVFHPVRQLWPDGMSATMPDVAPDIGRGITVDNRSHARRGKLPGPGAVTSGLAFSRRLLESMLPMPEAIRITADNYLVFVALGLAPGFFLADVLATQRIHGANLYTWRRDRTLIQARVHLLIAEAMRRRYPQLTRLSNRLFSKGLADYVRALHRDGACEAAIGRYLTVTPVRQMPDLFLRAVYHGARRLVVGQTG